MFTKKDYRAFFSELMTLEVEMEREMKALAKRMPDKDVRGIFLQIAADERRHQKIVQRMFDLIA